MEQNKDIYNELRQLAPTLAAVGHSTPYVVPEGYFNSFPIETLLKAAGPLSQPAVPENYFEQLPLQMLLKTGSGGMSGTVPAGYFETFADSMLAKVRTISSGTQDEELPAIFSQISKKAPYTTPAGYFDQVVAIPQPALAPTDRSPVVSLPARARLWKWAVAACAIALAGLFSWQFLFQPNNVSPGANLAKTSNTDSVALAQLASALIQLEEQALNSELNEKGMSQDAQTAVLYLNTDNFENALKSLSDEELEQSLAELGG